MEDASSVLVKLDREDDIAAGAWCFATILHNPPNPSPLTKALAGSVSLTNVHGDATQMSYVIPDINQGWGTPFLSPLLHQQIPRSIQP